MPPPTPPILPQTSAPRMSEGQLMTAHRHKDTLPLGSRPGKVGHRRDVQRFHPTGTPANAPATRPVTKPRPSSLGPPNPARRSLFDKGERRNPARTPRHRRGLPRRSPPNGADTCGDTGAYTGHTAPRGGPHGYGRAPARRTGKGPFPTRQPPTTAPDRGPHASVGDVVLPDATVRAPQGGLADRVGMPTVVGVPPPLGAPIDRCGPNGSVA